MCSEIGGCISQPIFIMFVTLICFGCNMNWPEKVPNTIKQPMKCVHWHFKYPNKSLK